MTFTIEALGSKVSYFECARCGNVTIDVSEKPIGNGVPELERHCCDDCYRNTIPGRHRWRTVDNKMPWPPRKPAPEGNRKGWRHSR